MGHSVSAQGLEMTKKSLWVSPLLTEVTPQSWERGKNRKTSWRSDRSSSRGRSSPTFPG